MGQDTSKPIEPHTPLNKIETAILLGLKEFGRKKTFAEILDAAKLPQGDAIRFQVASSLEARGLIMNISYQLPVKIRAELSAEGEEFVKSLKEDAAQRFSFPNRINPRLRP